MKKKWFGIKILQNKHFLYNNLTFKRAIVILKVCKVWCVRFKINANLWFYKSKLLILLNKVDFELKNIHF
jgi:hypothetical protein